MINYDCVCNLSNSSFSPVIVESFQNIALDHFLLLTLGNNNAEHLAIKKNIMNNHNKAIYPQNQRFKRLGQKIKTKR